MKVISLNIWGGHLYQPLIQFFKYNHDVNIFCLQEVYHNAIEVVSTEDRFHHLNILEALSKILPYHHVSFCPVVNNSYGLAMLIHQDVEVLMEDTLMIYENPDYIGKGPTHKRVLQFMKCQFQGEIYSIANVHGLWNGKGKGDSQARIKQSNIISGFINADLNAKKIICGDFNLRPETQSMKILEKNMINLINKFDITSTRTRFYPKEEQYADYILVSQDVRVGEFKVLPDEVSDHKALLLDVL